MTGEPLGVGDGDLGGLLTEGAAKGLHLGIGTAAPGRSIGLMGHEEGLGCVEAAIQTMASLHAFDEAAHLFGQMLLIDTGGVEGAVADIRPEDLCLSDSSAVD